MQGPSTFPLILAKPLGFSHSRRWGWTRSAIGSDHLMARPVQSPPLALAAVLLALPLLTPCPAVAQKRIPKLPGYDQCPLGYVNDLRQHCNSPIYYEVKPTYGKPCDSGWMNIGAGYCKKKTLGIF
jgi:hypothetical protein